MLSEVRLIIDTPHAPLQLFVHYRFLLILFFSFYVEIFFFVNWLDDVELYDVVPCKLVVLTARRYKHFRSNTRNNMQDCVFRPILQGKSNRMLTYQQLFTYNGKIECCIINCCDGLNLLFHDVQLARSLLCFQKC